MEIIMEAFEKIIIERKLLEQLVKSGNKFRNTPIVDNDFCMNRNEFDMILTEATEYIKNNKPVCVSKQRMIADDCMGE